MSHSPGECKPIRIADDHFEAMVTIVNEMGMHARPATLLVKTAHRFPCDVVIQKEDQKVDGKSILQLLSLSAERGTLLRLETKGGDALAAIQEISGLIQRGFDESASAAGSE